MKDDVPPYLKSRWEEGKDLPVVEVGVPTDGAGVEGERATLRAAVTEFVVRDLGYDLGLELKALMKVC